MKSKAQERAEQYRAELAFYKLSRFPHHQAETIARHYSAHTVTVLEILHALEEAKFSPNPILPTFVNRQIGVIKANHLHDFGIALEWNNDTKVSARAAAIKQVAQLVRDHNISFNEMEEAFKKL